MKGRWAETLELTQASPFELVKLANFPDPITIFPGDSAILDIFVKYDNDNEAYGWNNEAYLHNWRTPYYQLDPGDYDIEIILSGVNAQTKKIVKGHIGTTTDTTYLRS